MNIAIFIPNIKPICGRSKIGISLIKGLKEKGNNVFLITNPESDLSLISNAKFQSLIVPCDPNKKSLYPFIKCNYSIKKFVKENQIDLINTHHRYVEFISLFSRFIFRLDVKIITTVHSYTKGLKHLSYNADKLIAVSNYIKDHLINYYGKNNSDLELIYNGAEKEYEEGFHSTNNEKYILGFGRLYHQKGFDILIQALNLLQNKINLPKLVLIGAGEDKLKLQKLAYTKNIAIEFLESRSTPWEKIKNSLFIIVPSREEPFGLVILEAGMMGKAIIASNVGGIPEIIDENKSGLLFEGENYIQLAEQISKLIIDRALANQLGLELKQRVERQFSYNQMIENYISVFKNLLK